MMFSWLIFCRDDGVELRLRKTKVLHLKYFMAKKTLKYRFITKTNLTISSSKQSFEEETSLNIIDDENLEMKTY